MSHMVRRDIPASPASSVRASFLLMPLVRLRMESTVAGEAKLAQNQSRHMRRHREDDTISPDQGVGQVAW